MINSFLKLQIKEYFHFPPTPEQDKAIDALAGFLYSAETDSVFLLKGFAGTGKTSLVAALVRVLDKLKQRVVLLAPTGRAAKVLSGYAGHPAYTIHRKIYRQKSLADEAAGFSLNNNLHQHTLFIVDEASMIANDGLSGSVFGTGRLLDDLMRYVYSGQGCRLVLMGDKAQLPPVGESESPALSAQVLAGYSLRVVEAGLTQVVRQLESSGILWNATSLRRLMTAGDLADFPRVRFAGFADIRNLPGNELIEAIENAYANGGMEETMVICRSNKRANLYNNGIRTRILYREEELSSGDLLMIAKNNYFWTEQEKAVDFIANGDVAVVRRVRRVRQLYGFRFADAVLRFPDYDDFEMEATILLDTLQSDSPSLSREEADRLFYAVLEDYADVPLKRDRMKKMKQDPHYNALQVKFAYAVTCHKAQGGQWRTVFLDQGYVTKENLTPDYFRWLYTAFTRATEKLYLVNWPKEQTEE